MHDVRWTSVLHQPERSVDLESYRALDILEEKGVPAHSLLHCNHKVIIKNIGESVNHGCEGDDGRDLITVSYGHCLRMKCVLYSIHGKP